MKFMFTWFLVLSVLHHSNAQRQSVQSDTSGNRKSKSNPLFIKLQSRNVLGIIHPAAAAYHFGSLAGTGAEALLGFKISKKYAFGFGLQKTKYFIMDSKVKQVLTTQFTSAETDAVVHNTGNSSLSQNAFFIYLSRRLQKKRNVLEFYAKVNLSSFQYKLKSNMAWIHKKYNDTVWLNYENGLSNTALIWGAGVHYSRQIAKVLFAGAGVEYSHNINPEIRMYRRAVYANGEKERYLKDLFPTPLHFLQLNIGLMYQPYKPCNCKEQKPW